MNGGVGLRGVCRRHGPRGLRVPMLAACVFCCASAAAADLQGPATQLLPPLPLSTPAAVGPGLPRPWIFSASGGADVTFTDNVLLTQGARKSDAIFTPRAELELRGTSSHAGLDAKAEMAYDFYANTSALNGARPRALIDGYADIADKNFTIDGRLATDLRSISQEDRAPVTDRSFGQNQTQVLSYGLTPRFQEQLGDFAKVQAHYDFSGVNFFDPPAGTVTTIGLGDTTRHAVEASIASPDSLRMIEWSALGSYEHSHSGGALGGSERARGEGRLQYNASGTFAVTGRGGYDWINEPSLIQSPDGPYGLAGILWRPGSRTDVRAEAGYRYGNFSAEAAITYRRSQLLNFSLSYTRDVETTQRLLAISLANLTHDEIGKLIDPLTGLPPDPNSILFGLTNQAFKRDAFQFGVNGTFGRNFYNIGGTYERRHANSAVSESWQGNATIGRRLTPRLQASAQIAYNNTQGDPATAGTRFDSKTKIAVARADYQLGRTVTTGIKYYYMERATTLVAYRENVAMISISKVF